MNEIAKCPMHGVTANVTFARQSNKDWWPNQLNLKILHQNPPALNPNGEAFSYREEFKKLDFAALNVQER